MTAHDSAERLTGRCRCGAITYTTAPPLQAAICHCEDCRRSSGAPMVAWMSVAAASLKVTTGTPKEWSSDGRSRRYFCADCGTGLFYKNEELIPGTIDVQIATLEKPAQIVPDIQVQVAERLSWIEDVASLPTFDRYPD